MFSVLKNLGLKGTNKPESNKTELKPLAVNKGGCTATNRIVVDGKKVGWMYRQLPHHEIDNGWSFFSGDESSEYLNNLSNTKIYDTNTIANLDPDIIPFLHFPYFSAFERDPKTKKFRQVFDFEFPDKKSSAQFTPAQHFNVLMNKIGYIRKEHSDEIINGNFLNFEQFFKNKKVNGISISQKEIGFLKTKGKKIIVSDPLSIGHYVNNPLVRTVDQENYPVILSIASFNPKTNGKRVAFAKVRFSDKRVSTWEKAEVENFDLGFFGVDSGLAGVMDMDAAKLMAKEIKDYESKNPEKNNFYKDILSNSFDGHEDWAIYNPGSQKDMNVVIFHSGMGDGMYSSFWGLDKNGKPVCLIIDFSLFTEKDSIECTLL